MLNVLEVYLLHHYDTRMIHCIPMCSLFQYKCFMCALTLNYMFATKKFLNQIEVPQAVLEQF